MLYQQNLENLVIYKRRVQMLRGVQPLFDTSWLGMRVGSLMAISYMLKIMHDSRSDFPMAVFSMWTQRGIESPSWTIQLTYYADFNHSTEYTLPFDVLNQTNRPVFPDLRIHFHDGRLITDPEDRIVVMSDWNIPGSWFDLNWSAMIRDFNMVNAIPPESIWKDIRE